MPTAKILTLVGSLRGASANRIVAQAAMDNVPDGVEFTEFDLRDLPLYDGDVEAAGLPDQVQSLHDQVAAADGLLIFSPEYNSSFPAVTKNAIDWMTRPPRPWAGTAVSIIVATPGARAGTGIRDHFASILVHQPVDVFPSLGIGTYGEKLADGEVTDAATLAEIIDHVKRFAAFCLEDRS